MNPVWIWISAVLVYALFSLWYNNWRPPLDAGEIDHYLSRFDAAGVEAPDPQRRATLRRFLESDDGREFFMVNLIRLHPGDVTVPGAASPAPAASVLERYTGYFMPALFRRAGHPAFFGQAAGSYLESWAVEPDPGWSFTGVIRYRSRRDLIELATNPAFDPAHGFKIAAIASTFAFPAAPGMVFLGPRVWVALLLALFAALGHLLLLHLPSRG